MFIKGNFLFTPSRHELTIRENQYAHIENGVVTGFMTDLPETTGPETVVDYNQDIIIPAFVDLHIHAPEGASSVHGLIKALVPADTKPGVLVPLTSESRVLLCLPVAPGAARPSRTMGAN